jgi:hypothetical protein
MRQDSEVPFRKSSGPLYGGDRSALDLLEISRRFLPALAIVLKLEADFLTFPKVPHSGPLNCGYVDENVRAAAVWLNEPESLGALNHLTVPVAMLYSFPVAGEDRSITDAVAGSNSWALNRSYPPP